MKLLRDETFWRDIVGNIISGTGLALVVWLGGIALGYFNAPVHPALVITVLLYIVDVAMFGRMIYVRHVTDAYLLPGSCAS